MIVEKISNDKFTLQKDGENYVLYMGTFTPQTPRAFTLKLTVEDSSKVTVVPACGCTTAEKKIENATTFITTLSYNNCDPIVDKVVTITNHHKKIKLRIKGSCQNR